MILYREIDNFTLYINAQKLPPPNPLADRRGDEYALQDARIYFHENMPIDYEINELFISMDMSDYKTMKGENIKGFITQIGYDNSSIFNPVGSVFSEYSIRKMIIGPTPYLKIMPLTFAGYGKRGIIKKLTLPENTHIISKMAFLFAPIKHITIPKNVACIEECAFEKSELVSVEIENDWTFIEKGAFRDCALLEKVRFGKSDYNVFPINLIKTRAFYNTALTDIKLISVTFPTEKRYGEIFANCKRLRTVVLDYWNENVSSTLFKNSGTDDGIVFIMTNKFCKHSYLTKLIPIDFELVAKEFKFQEKNQDFYTENGCIIKMPSSQRDATIIRVPKLRRGCAVFSESINKVSKKAFASSKFNKVTFNGDIKYTN